MHSEIDGDNFLQSIHHSSKESLKNLINHADWKTIYQNADDVLAYFCFSPGSNIAILSKTEDMLSLKRGTKT